MQPRVVKLVESVRSSYWFVPTLMAAAAVLLGVGVVYVDAAIGSDWLNGLSFYQPNKPEGAQQVLSTIAGSAITVAGVVFSVTIVSVSFAASQYGPRVLSNFMSDRGNQITLGTFIATFLYCLVVLRTIRGGDEGYFVPDLAIIIALLFAFCSIGVLIFFIHHVPRSIHVNTVVAGIGRQLITSLRERFPELVSQSEMKDRVDPANIPESLADELPCVAGDVAPIPSSGTGYIETIDEERLVQIACRSGLILRLRYQPGDYIHAGRSFVLAWPANRSSEKTVKQLQATFAVSRRRTPLQDTRFLIDELVEVGTRALSPGVNDPFTAMTCLDWLGAALSEAARRELPGPHRLDENGDLRVIAAPLTFAKYVDRALGQFRQYLASDKNACLHALLTIERIADACVEHQQIAELSREVEALRSAAGDALEASSFALVDEEARSMSTRLRGRSPSARVRNT